MLCRDLRDFLGSVRAYGGEAPCGEGEGFATQLTGRIKSKTNFFQCVYPDHTSNERTCTPKVGTLRLPQGYRGVLRITEVDPSCIHCRCGVGGFSRYAFHYGTAAPWEAGDIHMDIYAVIP